MQFVSNIQEPENEMFLVERQNDGFLKSKQRGWELIRVLVRIYSWWELMRGLARFTSNMQFYHMAFQNSLFWLVDKRSVKTHIRTVVRIFRIWTGVPGVVYLAWSFKLCIMVFLDVSPLQTCVSLKFTDKNFKQPNCFWLSMHVYRILLPSETDDSRFNSREKHMLTDSVQPYNKPIIDLACSVCTVKYQTSVFCMDLAPSSLGPY